MNNYEQTVLSIKNPFLKYLVRVIVMTVTIGSTPAWLVEKAVSLCVRTAIILPIQVAMLLVIVPISAGICLYKCCKSGS